MSEPQERVDCAYNLGVVLTEQGRLSEAVQGYELALQLDPLHENSLLNLANLMLHLSTVSTDQSLSSKLRSSAKDLVVKCMGAHPTSEDAKMMMSKF